MEEIAFQKIEEIVLKKHFSELSQTELKLIKKHFSNEEEYNSFRAIISQNIIDDEAFPDEIDEVIFQKLNEKEKSKPLLLFFQRFKKLAVAAMIILSFGLGFISNFLKEKETQIVEIIKKQTDTISIEKQVYIIDTLIQTKVVYKEKIVEVIVEKEIEKIVNVDISTPVNYDSIPLMNQEIVENNSLNQMKDLTFFYTVF